MLINLKFTRNYYFLKYPEYIIFRSNVEAIYNNDFVRRFEFDDTHFEDLFAEIEMFHKRFSFRYSSEHHEQTYDMDTYLGTIYPRLERVTIGYATAELGGLDHLQWLNDRLTNLEERMIHAN